MPNLLPIVRPRTKKTGETRLAVALRNVGKLWPVSRRTRGSVFGRLRLVLAGVFLFGAALALGAAWLFSNTAANETYDRLLISAAVQMAETVGVEQNQVMATPPDAAFETLAQAHDDRVFYAIRDPEGRLVTGDARLEGPGADDDLDRPRIDDGHFMGLPVRTATTGRYVTTQDGGGWTSIVVAQTRQARTELAVALMAKIGALIVFVSLLGYAASLVAARRALLPLSRIEQALAARDANDVSPLNVESPRETQALVDAINLVMGRLADRMSKLQGFIGVAAHQTRTPIAALIAQVDLLQNDRTAPARNSRIERIRDRLIELGRLTNQLLGHAMIVYRSEIMPHGPVDLAEVARAAARDGVPFAIDRDLMVTVEVTPEPFMVQGDAVSLREGLTNLVNNAVVHGAPSRLAIRVFQRGDDAVVGVFDDGQGMPPEAWPAALSPFTAPRTGRPGAGLGLSIVNTLVEAHSGRIEFALPDGGGFEVRLVIPMQSDR